MQLKEIAPYLIVLLVFSSLLMFYTAFDKKTKTLVPDKLVNVLTFQDPTNSFKEFNKVFALAAIGIISIVFLLGPLSKLFPAKFGHFLYMRKTLGIIGFGIAALHAIYSFIEFYKFSLVKMFIENAKFIGIVSATVSLLIFFIMTATSTKNMMVRLGYQKWKAIQTFGYVALALALLHFYLYETKPDIGLDVRPFGMLFFYLPIAALLLRAIIIFMKTPEHKTFEEHMGEKPAN